MSIAKLNEDYLMNQKEDCSNINILGNSIKNPIINIKNSDKNNKNVSNEILKSDSFTEFNIKFNKNSESNEVLKHGILASKGKNYENINVKHNVNLYDNDLLSQMERNIGNNLYGNFENLMCEEDNSFSFESFNKKNKNFQGSEVKNIFSENTSVIAEESFSSNLINNNIINSYNTTCNLNLNNKRNLKMQLKARYNYNNIDNNDIIKTNIENSNNNNFNDNDNNKNYNKADKIFSDYNFSLIDNDLQCRQNNLDSCDLMNSNQENSSFNSLLDINYNKNNLHKNSKKFNYCIGKKTGKWSDEEDRILYQLVPSYGAKNWKKIAEKIEGRSPIQCLHRWTKILQPGLVKGPWTIEEDRKLLEWVKQEGPVKWTQCSEFIKGRNGKQCRERWFHTLNPKIIKGNWTAEEDMKIFTLYNQLGGKWSKITLSIPGRTENSIKNRFYSTLRRKAVEQAKSQCNVKNSNLNSITGDNAHCPNYDYNNYKAQKLNQINNFGSNYNLDELLDFLPQALLEVKIKYVKEFNLTSDNMAIKENEILQGEVLMEQKIKADHLKGKLYEENVFNVQSNNVNNNNSNINNNNLSTTPQMINLNVNFNSNHNNYIVGNQKIMNKQNHEIINSANNNLINQDPLLLSKNNGLAEFNHYKVFQDRIPSFKEEMNLNNKINNNINSFNNDNQFNFDFSNQAVDYKNMDLFTLENNIFDMCDNPNFMYSDNNNFGFLDTHVDHIIDSMFLNNNLILTNDKEKDCDMCSINNNHNSQKQTIIDESKNIKPESLLGNRIDVSNKKANKEPKIITDKNGLSNKTKAVPVKNEIKSPFEVLPKLKSKKELDLGLKEEEKNKLQQQTKKQNLSSLINQLEDLERLVQNTKKELMKYNEKADVEGSTSEEAIFSTVSLTNTIQKLFK